MNTLILILQGAQLVGSLIVAGEQIAADIKKAVELDPNFKVNVVNLESSAITADEQTIDTIARWQTLRGLPVTVQPAPAAPKPAA